MSSQRWQSNHVCASEILTMKDLFESKYKYYSSKSTPHLLVPQQHCGSVVLETEQMDMIS